MLWDVPRAHSISTGQHITGCVPTTVMMCRQPSAHQPTSQLVVVLNLVHILEPRPNTLLVAYIALLMSCISKNPDVLYVWPFVLFASCLQNHAASSLNYVQTVSETTVVGSLFVFKRFLYFQFHDSTKATTI